MANTGFDNGTAVLENKANNYMHDYGTTVRVPYVNNLFLMGAGALVSNCDDLQKWYDCLKQRKLLSAKMSVSVFLPASVFIFPVG